ncbi:MAG: hypothetical protein RMJ88_13425 [Thermogemmata sp.]|nr:hypothetical protein [Thermogemmata sp.]
MLDAEWWVWGALVWVGDCLHGLIVCSNESTAGVQYIAEQAVDEPLPWALTVALRRWRVVQTIQLFKQAPDTVW